MQTLDIYDSISGNDLESYLSFSDRHEAFCQEYVKDRNATQAAIRAGYSPKTGYSQGHRLLKNAEVASRIRELQAEAAARNERDVDGILADLRRVYDGAFEAGNFAACNRALELEARLLGHFVEKSDIRMHSTSIPANQEDMDREIARLAGILGWEVKPKAE